MRAASYSFECHTTDNEIVFHAEEGLLGTVVEVLQITGEIGQTIQGPTQQECAEIAGRLSNLLRETIDPDAMRIGEPIIPQMIRMPVVLPESVAFAWREVAKEVANEQPKMPREYFREYTPGENL